MPKILTSTLNKLGYTVIFKTNNRLRNLVRPVVQTTIESKTGIYKLICDDCDRFYIGQTGRPFIKRFREHTPQSHFNRGDFSIDNIKSNFTRHLISCNHSYTNFNNNFIPLHYCAKGRYMDALEEFEIYRGHNNPGAVSYTHLDVYKRQVNLTDIAFDNDEINLLNKGLDYNFPPDNKHNIVDEIINAETAVKAIDDSRLQNQSRHIINYKFNKILNNRNTCLLYTSRCV